MTMGRLDLSNFYDFLIFFECHHDLSCKVLCLIKKAIFVNMHYFNFSLVTNYFL